MKHTLVGFVPLLALGLLSGCGAEPASNEAVADIQQALNVCTETVPADRFVDGFPAYSQCDATTSASIWSNNGIDTSLTSGGADWVQTQRGGGYQCTELARRYMLFKWKVNYQHGNAQEWCDGTLPSTLVKSTTPVHGDLIVFQGGVCGSDPSTGHIAVIDTVNASAGTVTFIEQNRASRRTAKQSCGLCFLHAVANDGSSAGAAGTAGASAGGATSTSGGTAGMASTSGGTSGGGGRFGGTGGAAVGSGGAPSSNGGAPPGLGGAPTTGGASSNGGAPAAQGGASTGGSTNAAGGAPTAAAGAPTSSGAPSSGVSGSPGTSGSPGASTDDTTAIEGGCSLTGPVMPGSKGTPFVILSGLALVWARRRRR